GFAALVPGRDDAGPAAAQQRMVDPALGALRIADAAPVLEFGDDLHRHAGAVEDPAHGIVLARSRPHVDPVRLQADETRQGQAARPLPDRVYAAGDELV